MTEHVGFSPKRIWVIAGNTFTEAVRQKVYLVLLIVGLIVLASASFFAQFSFSEQLKFVKDFCLGVLWVFGTLIAIVSSAQMLPNELENRTVYTILAKPVRRIEFLLGKYVGSLMLVLLTVLVMSGLIALVLVFKEQRLVADTLREAAGATDTEEVQHMLAQIRTEAFDPDLIKGVILIFVHFALISAITLFFSTFSTSMLFNISVAFMAFLAGHLRGTAIEVWGNHRFVMALLAIVPDLGVFNVTDDIVLGNVISWAHVGSVVLYGVLRTAVVLVAAQLIFARREI